jgi:hypothetical protein
MTDEGIYGKHSARRETLAKVKKAGSASRDRPKQNGKEYQDPNPT